MARRTDVAHDVYLILHGHFYQPPRENPWLDIIERESSADPFPNWNARITEECYATNGWARIFNPQGKIAELLNNYCYMSFNFGPTLLSWLEAHRPEVYARILDADRKSVIAHTGHGNALAQAYSHPILPLCNSRDRLTQIRWGTRDFKHRFGRDPESLWLPETAIDSATLEDLIAEGIKFIILSPRQASRVRRLDEETWHDVSGTKIDPRQAYRCFSTKDVTRYLDVFFYDGPVSHAISFEKVLYSSSELVDKLWGAVDMGRTGPQLIHAAVDGETFGHHLRHAERALSYAFTSEAPQRGFMLTNYGEYLERFPPQHEVELDFGPQGEGSSWSCVHGVGRWYRDCSCHTGAPEGWNQLWREPLRNAIYLVRDEAAALFEDLGHELLVDPWEARDAYISLMLDSSPASRERYFQQYGHEGRRLTHQVRMLKLLEMQRYSLLAQTSCGWFFNDISGLEAVQVLKYAARTLQILEELSGRNVERDFLNVLAEAQSNISSFGTGADVYRQLVLPSSIDRHRLVAQYAITDMFHNHPVSHTYYGYQVQRLEQRRFSSGPVTLIYGRLQVEFLRTCECSDMMYGLIHFGGHDFHCAVSSFAGIREFRRFIEDLENIFDRATITELLRLVDLHFGETYYGLKHLLPEERERVLDGLFGHLTENFAQMYMRLYEENRRAVNALIDTGLKIPHEFRIAAEYTLSRDFNAEIRNHQGSNALDNYRKAKEIVAEANLRGYKLDQSESEKIFGEMINTAVRSLVNQPSSQTCREALDVLSLAESLKIFLPLEHAQNMLFDRLRFLENSSEWSSFQPLLLELLAKMHLAAEIVPWLSS